MLYCENKVKFEKESGYRTAGKKAPDDIALFAEKMGFQIIPFDEVDFNLNPVHRIIKNAIVSKQNWKRISDCINDNDTLLLQHPYEGLKLTAKHIQDIKKKYKVHIILLIHDLNCLRSNIEISHSKWMSSLNAESEVAILQSVDYIIAHNERMKAFLVDTLSIDQKKIYCLQLFDYYHMCDIKKSRQFDGSVTVAGNLQPEKCKYLYKFIDECKLKGGLHLYGPNFDTNYNKNVVYHGLVPADRLPGEIEGSFGLVWDGLEIDECSGNAGEYIKYNNPHKCSLYISSGLPVVIWDKAALADFVTEHKVGITVSSLRNLESAIAQVSADEYNNMVDNAVSLGKQLTQGFYFNSVLERIKLDGETLC